MHRLHRAGAPHSNGLVSSDDSPRHRYGPASRHFARFKQSPSWCTLAPSNHSSLLKEIEMNKSMTIAIRAIAIGAVVALGFGAESATAAGPSNDQPVSDGAKQYVVRFADLDLSKMTGATALYVRLQHAARAVCDPREGRELAFDTRFRACVDQAVTSAVARVNSPLVSEYHRLR